MPIGFTFPFYGNNFASINVSTNGWLTFTSTSSDLSATARCPAPAAPENLIAVFQDDLRFSSATAAAHYYNDGSRFIVQYTDVQKYFSSGSLTFQVILYPNGKIVYQYLTMTGALLDSSTVGIQNDDRTIGLQVAYNETYIHDNLAVQFSTTPDWLTVTPPSATVPAGGSVNFDVVFDATDREGGDYTGAVVLNTNIGEFRAPATLHVIGVPIADIIPDAYDYGTRYVGYSHLTNFRVVNTGTDVLNVSDVVTTDPTLIISEQQTGAGGQEITQINAGFSLTPGSARLFTLVWQPVAAVPLAAQVVVHSDDPVNPTISHERHRQRHLPAHRGLVAGVVHREPAGRRRGQPHAAPGEQRRQRPELHRCVAGTRRGERHGLPGRQGRQGRRTARPRHPGHPADRTCSATSGSIPTNRADRPSTGWTSRRSARRSIWDRHPPTTTTPARSTWA